MVENKLWLAITCLPVFFIFWVQYTYRYTCLGLYEKIPPTESDRMYLYTFAPTKCIIELCRKVNTMNNI
jgi:hypothetical protein